MNRPVFVVACGRSGSTALCNALGEHQQILMAKAEAPLIHRIGMIAHDYALGTNSRYYQYSVQMDINDFQRTLIHMCIYSVFGKNLIKRYKNIWLEMIKAAFGRKMKLQFWGAKAFPSEKAAKGLMWLFPGVKFVYLFRNGLDVVHSMSRFGNFKKMSIQERCQFWRQRVYQYDYLKHHRSAITVKYEEFLNDNQNVLCSIFEHLGVDYDPRPSKYASSVLVHSLDRPTRIADPKVELLNRQHGYLRWSAEERQTFKALCTEAMQSLGYDLPF